MSIQPIAFAEIIVGFGFQWSSNCGSFFISTLALLAASRIGEINLPIIINLEPSQYTPSIMFLGAMPK